MQSAWVRSIRFSLLILATCASFTAPVSGQLVNPLLTTVYPPGGQRGTTFEVSVEGGGLDGLTALKCGHPGITFTPIEGNRFRATIADDVETGGYDLRAVSAAGMSSPRLFRVGTVSEQVEPAPDKESDTAEESAEIPELAVNSLVNGRIEKKGDVDQFRFAARGGERVIIECRADRIDSKLRAVLELYDPAGRRLAVNRGYFGVDPLIDYRIPAVGTYSVKLYDLTYTGSNEHFYRLSVGTKPRVVFTVPAAIEAGKTTRLSLFGWNLGPIEATIAANANVTADVNGAEFGTATESDQNGVKTDGPFDRIDVEITAPPAADQSPLPMLLRSNQAALDLFAYRHPGIDEPIAIGLADVPVVRDAIDNHSPAQAQVIEFPVEVNGQLIAGDERDWFAITVRRGEVLWLEAFGQRIGSPVDLDLTLLDAGGNHELAHFRDELTNLGGRRFPSDHLDPSGRWVAPADGRYLIVVRNLIGGLHEEPRRRYRLTVRREEPAFDLVVVPGRGESPAGWNVPCGGRGLAEVFAFRRRGMTGAIRVSADELPPHVDCPDIWLGPGVDRGVIVVSARENAEVMSGQLKLSARSEQAGVEPVESIRGGVMVRTDLPNGTGRITAEVPLAIAGEIPVRLTADVERKKYPQGSIVNLTVDVERRSGQSAAAVHLTGIGLPKSFDNQTAVIPADTTRGYLCFHLPAGLPAGRYTIAVEGQTTMNVGPADKSGKRPTAGATLVSNPVSFDVYPAPFLLAVDLNAPRKMKRGEIIKLNYSAKRRNGFIGKIHTELFMPDGVVGIRGRGVTFVGQTQTGTIQIIASDDAPLGRLKFLQLEGLGTVEDDPIYRGSCFVDLEIVE